MGRLWTIVALLALALAAGLAYLRLSPVLAQDICLDGGGAWRGGQCLGRRPDG